MQVGLLFGTFDPPHRAHVAIAEHMCRHAGLDEVWLVVTPQNPFKQDRQLSADHHRLAMVQAAVDGHEGLRASDVEFALPRPSYTAHSLRHLRAHWPAHTFTLIIGSDNLAAFHRWKDPDDILAHHRLLVYPREGVQDHRAQSTVMESGRVVVVDDAPLLPMAATGLRERLRQGLPVDGFLDPAVLAYIRAQGLYTS